MYLQGRYAEAYRELVPLARRGVVPAQSILGTIYHEGRGVSQDDAEAVRWFQLAAEAGDADSQFNLSVMFANGWGVLADATARVRWLRHAAEQGHALSQYSLGILYREGAGVPTDAGKALWWLRLAANQGDVSAQFVVGVMYFEGQADPDGSAFMSSMIHAHTWLSLASAQGDQRASKALEIVAQQMTQDAVAAAEQCAKDWQPESASDSALTLYRYEVDRFIQSFRDLAEANQTASLTAFRELQHRMNDLIDVGVILGAPVGDLVATLRNLYRAVTNELGRTVPETQELQARMDGLKEVSRAPGLRRWFKRPLITEDSRQHATGANGDDESE